MSELKTTWDNQLLVLKLVYEYFWRIYHWEKIGLDLASIAQVNDDSVEKYFKMVRLFTWWHIDYFLRIWQLIANKKVDSMLIDISTSLGIIRQICDDFDDYFPWHHEPFWDFMTQSNRLPEIAFTILWGDREEVETMILWKRFDSARSLILSSKVKEQLYEYCKLEHQKIKQINTTFDYESLLENYEKILL
jgi:geranylgeranyl pyrophosphate synthase